MTTTPTAEVLDKEIAEIQATKATLEEQRSKYHDIVEKQLDTYNALIRTKLEQKMDYYNAMAETYQDDHDHLGDFYKEKAEEIAWELSGAPDTIYFL